MIKDGDFPSLRTLKLAHCSLPWHAINLSGVTTLWLYYVHAESLIVLHLEDALPTARGFLSSGALDATPKVNLPSFAHLLVNAPLSFVAALLSCINIPLTTQVRLETEFEEDPSVDDYAQIPSLVAQRFSQSKDQSSSSPTIRSLAVRFAIDKSLFTLSASESGDCDPNLSVEYPSRACNSIFVIVIKTEEWILTSDHICIDICCSIPSTHIQTLHIINLPFSSDFWRKILGHLDGLCHIKLSKGDMPDLVSCLAVADGERGRVPRGHDRAPTPGRIFVPALEVLELHHITFPAEDDFPKTLPSLNNYYLMHCLHAERFVLVSLCANVMLKVKMNKATHWTGTDRYFDPSLGASKQ